MMNYVEILAELELPMDELDELEEGLDTGAIELPGLELDLDEPEAWERIAEAELDLDLMFIGGELPPLDPRQGCC